MSVLVCMEDIYFFAVDMGYFSDATGTLPFSTSFNYINLISQSWQQLEG